MKHHDEPAALSRQADELGIDLSGRQVASLLEYEKLLVERAVRLGLIARRDEPRLRERHVLDCLRAVSVVREDDRRGYDLGSGAGLPGIVVAIGVPSLQVTLLESQRRRVAFLELAIEQLNLPNVAIVEGRIERLHRALEPADLCFARALAPLGEAWLVAEPILGPTGRLVYFGGDALSDAVLRDTETSLAGARTEVVPGSHLLERSGPLVIMTRK